MKKENCIFCKIANGEVPSKTLYEDEKFRIILDLGPIDRGHALILPKEHADDLYELPEESASAIMILAKKNGSQNGRKASLCRLEPCTKQWCGGGTDSLSFSPAYDSQVFE
ncbi:HIT domain protein [Acetatifactor muris]|uniref:HIT domain protein n=1 Tax=Acetatifactor muris TaxID=879566 RepID=A0A2K4ZLH6_9FIRM|nr:HIT domain-containing protein [Acetatifactor muris]SOY31295.1 HIT domain protein [Acetatifactor muris]